MPDNTRGPRLKSASSLKHEMVRRDAMEKWERSQFKGHGVKIVRLQPSINNERMEKYQSRLGSVQSKTLSAKSKETRTTITASSSLSPYFKTVATQTSLSRAASAGIVRERPPGPPHRPSSTQSSQSRTYTARSLSCRPPSMYRNESLRTAAKLNRPPSHVYECDYRDDSRRSEYSQIPTRFDGTPVPLPGYVRGNEFLCHDNLDLGQKQYIWGIARVYSVSQLMALKQRQYQSLLDYEFHRRIQNKDLKEHERIKEWKDYERYCRFIKNYEQRIPRSKREREISPCQELSHIHRHTLKGWTTNANAREAYRPASEFDRRFPAESMCTSSMSEGTITGRFELRMVRKKNKPLERTGGDAKKPEKKVSLEDKENKEEEKKEEQLEEESGGKLDERPQFADKDDNVL